MTAPAKPHALIALVVCFLICAVVSAHAATFGVATETNVSVGSTIPPAPTAMVVCRYDFEPGNAHPDWSQGPDCPQSITQPAGSTVTFSVTPGAPGGTASSNQASASFGGAVANASAAADLGQGTLRAVASLSETTNFFATSSATAQFGDRLTFTIPGAGPSTVTNIDVYYRVSGTYSTNSGGATVDAWMNFGQGAMNYRGEYKPCCDALPPHIATQTSSGWVSADFTGTTPSTLVFHGVYALQGPNPIIDFVANLDVPCRGNSNPIAATLCDYGNTGRVRLAFPPGVTVATASGVFNPFGMPAHDFNHDGISDILLRNSGGGIGLWLMNSTPAVASALGVGSATNDWIIVGQRDFNGDGVADILFRNTNGSIAEWLMNGNGTIMSTVGLGNPTTNWNIVGTADFNHDGISDLLFRGGGTAVAIWFMNGSGMLGSAVGVGSLPNDWTVAGTGDFDGDGVSDILWYASTSGGVAAWLMNSNGTVKSAVGVGALPVGTWSIAGTGDFNGDGISDILLIGGGTAVAIWFMNSSGAVSSAQGVGPMPSGWTIAETGDLNHDGKADILWYNSTSGNIAAWVMNGATIAAAVSIGSLPPASWAIVTANGG